MTALSAAGHLEAMQADRKYCLPPEQVEQLILNFSRAYAAEVMIECGHTNKEIHEATQVNMCRISWMRTAYQVHHPKAELEMAYADLNKDFVHVTTKQERAFCNLFKCGIYHKDYKQLTARVDRR